MAAYKDVLGALSAHNRGGMVLKSWDAVSCATDLSLMSLHMCEPAMWVAML
jgi:hypothetical protein